MNAAQIAEVFNARRAGKGKWTAKCPVHDDRTPSLSIAEGKKVPVVLRCMSAGCDTKDILAAVGLTWQAVFDGKPPPQVRARTSRQERRAALERQLGLFILLQAIDGRKAYWAAAERRVRAELSELRCWLEPEKVVQEWRERCFQQKLQQVGWDGLWAELMASNVGAELKELNGRK